MASSRLSLNQSRGLDASHEVWSDSCGRLYGGYLISSSFEMPDGWHRQEIVNGLQEPGPLSWETCLPFLLTKYTQRCTQPPAGLSSFVVLANPATATPNQRPSVSSDTDDSVILNLFTPGSLTMLDKNPDTWETARAGV